MENYYHAVPIEECGYCISCHERGIEKNACFKINNGHEQYFHYCAKGYLWQVLNFYMLPNSFSEESITTTTTTIIKNIGHDSMKDVITLFIKLDIVNIDKLQQYLGQFNKTWNGENIITKG